MANSREPGISIIGAKELRRALKAAGKDLTQMNEAHRRVNAIVLPAAMAAAPRQSGALRKSIKASAARTRSTLKAGNRRKGGPTAVPYAAPIHWGWPARGIRQNAFLTDAAEKTRPRWVDEYQKAIDEIIEKEFK